MYRYVPRYNGEDKMARYGRFHCSVPGCRNWGPKAPKGTSWHTFPENEALRKEWLTKIRRSFAPFQVRSGSFVCSSHFQPEDFRPLLHSKRKYLKPNATPSVFPWNTGKKPTDEAAMQVNFNLNLNKKRNGDSNNAAQRCRLQKRLCEQQLDTSDLSATIWEVSTGADLENHHKCDDIMPVIRDDQQQIKFPDDELTNGNIQITPAFCSLTESEKRLKTLKELQYCLHKAKEELASLQDLHNSLQENNEYLADKIHDLTAENELISRRNDALRVNFLSRLREEDALAAMEDTEMCDQETETTEQSESHLISSNFSDASCAVLLSEIKLENEDEELDEEHEDANANFEDFQLENDGDIEKMSSQNDEEEYYEVDLKIVKRESDEEEVSLSRNADQYLEESDEIMENDGKSYEIWNENDIPFEHNDIKINDESAQHVGNILATTYRILPAEKSQIASLPKRPLRFKYIKHDERLVRFYTGFANADAFDALYDFLKPRAEQMNYWVSKRINTDEKRCITSFEVSTIPTKEMFFLTLLRLKLAFPCSKIAVIFRISQPTVTRIFTTWVTFLYHELRGLFPVLPCVQLIVDCSELNIQIHSSQKCRKGTFSSYKQANTMKFLIAATLNDTVCFVSDVYNGCIADSNLIVACGILNLLSRGHSIIADNSLQISNRLPEGVELNMFPKYCPQTHKKDGDVAVELELNRRISNSRVHIEHIIRRMKTYKILSSVIPLSIRDEIDQIVNVCALLCNFKPGIRKSDITTQK